MAAVTKAQIAEQYQKLPHKLRAATLRRCTCQKKPMDRQRKDCEVVFRIDLDCPIHGPSEDT